MLSRETSLYLDLVRFIAAFVVVSVHSYGAGITGGFLWQLGDYGQTAVMIFFVLSGYVIAFVAFNKERNIRDYTFARCARLYSIVIPAIVITLICNGIGNIYISPDYLGPWNAHEQHEYLRYLATLFMLQDVWSIGLSPINNGSFWSISYEAFYYLLFATIFYLKGHKRVFFFILFSLLAGPGIMLLFPLWLLGFLAYYIHRNGLLGLNKKVAYFMFLFGGGSLVFSPEVRKYFDLVLPLVPRESIVGDYFDALSFFVHLLAVPIVSRDVYGLLRLFRTQILFFSGLTFSLYLFHLPLIRLFAGISPFIDDPGSVENRVFIYVMVFLVIILIGIPAEKSKKYLNKKIRSLVRYMSQLTTLPSRIADSSLNSISLLTSCEEVVEQSPQRRIPPDGGRGMK